MVPPAPPWFSTTTCWPSWSLRCWAVSRAIMSTPPPAVSGTTSLIGRLGQASCAASGPLAATTSASAPKQRGNKWRADGERVARLMSIVFLPGRPRRILPDHRHAPHLLWRNLREVLARRAYACDDCSGQAAIVHQGRRYRSIQAGGKHVHAETQDRA